MKIDDGGAAFPDDRSQDGMSLRDYFAAKAMQGFAMHARAPELFRVHSDVARVAYKWADAMISERSRKGVTE